MIISPTIAGAYRIRVKNTRILNHSVRLRRMFTKEEKIDSVKNDGYIYKDMYFQEIRVLNRETDIEIQKGPDWVFVEIGTREDKFIDLLKEISAYLIGEIDKYKDPVVPEYSCEFHSEKEQGALPVLDSKNEEILKRIAAEANAITKDATFDLVDEPITIQAPVQPPAMETFNEEIKKATDPVTEEDHIENTDLKTEEEEIATTEEPAEKVTESKVIKPVIQQNNNRQVHPNINNRPQYNNKNKK